MPRVQACGLLWKAAARKLMCPLLSLYKAVGEPVLRRTAQAVRATQLLSEVYIFIITDTHTYIYIYMYIYISHINNMVLLYIGTEISRLLEEGQCEAQCDGAVVPGKHIFIEFWAKTLVPGWNPNGWLMDGGSQMWCFGFYPSSC